MGTYRGLFAERGRMKGNLFKVGFVLTMIGGACMDSDSLIFPLIMVAAGLIIMLIERGQYDTI